MQHNSEVMRICVQNWLQHIRQLYDIEQRLEEVRGAVILSAVKTSKITTSQTAENHTEEDIVRILELEDVWKSAYSEVEHVRKFCEGTDGRHVCWAHFIEGLSWVQIGRMIGYSERHVRRLAQEGTADLYEIAPEEYKRILPNAAPN